MKAKLKEQLKVAMKAQDKIRVETIRGVLSALQYEEDAQNTDSLPDTTSIEILKREIKKRKEELEFAEKANRPDAVERLKIEISVVESFLPSQMSATELESVISALKQEDPTRNMGAVMKLLKERHAGLYDAKAASEIAKRIAG